MALQVLLCRLEVDPVPCLHEKDGWVHETGWYSCLDGHVSCMQVHVAPLDAFNAHGSQCRKVLCEAHRGHDLSNSVGIWIAHDLMSVDVGWIR